MNDTEFQKALKMVLAFEGGWSNDPADPGGAAMFGVIQTVYSDWRTAQHLQVQSVQLISQAEVQSIYYAQYWLPVAPGRTWPLNDVLFDTAVNMGVGRARQFLEQAKAGPADTAPNRMKALASTVLDIRARYYRGIEARVRQVPARLAQPGGGSASHRGRVVTVIDPKRSVRAVRDRVEGGWAARTCSSPARCVRWSICKSSRWALCCLAPAVASVSASEPMGQVNTGRLPATSTPEPLRSRRASITRRAVAGTGISRTARSSLSRSTAPAGADNPPSTGPVQIRGRAVHGDRDATEPESV